MKIQLFYLTIFFLLVKTIFGYGDGIIVLDQNNFDQVLSQVKFVMVEFYLPNCPSCYRFAHEYSKAARAMAPYSPKIKFFEVDGSTEMTLIKQYNIKTFPSTKLFIQGSNNPLDYQGEADANEIINWVKSKCLTPTVEIRRIEEANKLIKDNYIVGFFFGNLMSEENENYLEVARQFEDILFLESDEKGLRNHFGVTKEPTFILFKHFDEGRNTFRGPFNVENLKRFIGLQKHPALIRFNKEIEMRIFGEGKDVLFLVIKKDNTDRAKEAEEAVRTIATKLKDKFIFTIVDFDDEIEIPITKHSSISLNSFLEVERENLPAIRLFQPNNRMRRYIFNGDINVDNLKKFINDFEHGGITPLYMSAPIPTRPYEGEVRVAVQKNYKEIVLNKDQDVVVLFCNPHHYICQSFEPIFSKLAKKLKEIKSITFVKVDTSLNEIEGVKQQSTLDILLYPKGKKEFPVLYHDQPNESSLLEFIKKYSDSFKSSDNV